MSDYVVMIAIDEDADPFDWDGEGPMGERAYGVGLAASTLTRGAYEPVWETFVWGVWTGDDDDTDWSGIYPSPESVRHEYLRELAIEQRKLRP